MSVSYISMVEIGSKSLFFLLTNYLSGILYCYISEVHMVLNTPFVLLLKLLISQISDITCNNNFQNREFVTCFSNLIINVTITYSR